MLLNNKILEEQKKGAIIGTSSLRREFQVKRKINNFNFKLYINLFKSCGIFLFKIILFNLLLF